MDERIIICCPELGSSSASALGAMTTKMCRTPNSLIQPPEVRSACCCFSIQLIIQYRPDAVTGSIRPPVRYRAIEINYIGQRGILIGGTWSRTFRHKQTRLDTATLHSSFLPCHHHNGMSLAASQLTVHFIHRVHSFLAVTPQKVSFQMISQVESSPRM